MNRVVLAAIAVVLAATVAAGCSDEDKVTNPGDPWSPPLLKPTSPASVLHNLNAAFVARKTAWLDSVLFDREAAGGLTEFSFGSYSPGGSYNRAGMLAWSREYFGCAGTTYCGLVIAHRPPTRSADGTLAVLVDSVKASLTVRDSLSGDCTNIVARGYGGRMYFKVQSVDASGDSLWRITSWSFGGRWFEGLPVQKPRTSPENVLFNLEQAYRFRKTAWYDSLLYDGNANGDRTGRFRFWFWQEDVQQGGIPWASWDRDDEMLSARQMMASTSVRAMSARLLNSAPVPIHEPGHSGERRVEVIDVNVAVVTSPQGGQDEVSYIVESNHGTFDFKVQYVTPEGDPVWRIVTWWDMGPGHGTQRTWGRLKTRYFGPAIEITP